MLRPPKAHLLGASVSDLEALLKELGQPAFRARQLRDWMFGSFESDFGKMSNLPKALQQALLSVRQSVDYQHPFYWSGFFLIGDGR